VTTGGEVDADDALTLDQQVCFTLSLAAREVVSLYRPLLRPLGLTHPQYLVMVTLWGVRRPLAVGELSRMLKLEAPTLSPLLKRLQTAGLIERQRDPDDERSVRVSLTERGQDLRVQAAGVPAALFERLGMPLEEIETLQRSLAAVIAYAKAQNDPADHEAEVPGT
jgi:DNA-binding MarR family transcriptional regulator